MSREYVEADITLDERELVPGGRATVRIRTLARAPVKIRGAHAAFRGFEETKAVYTTSDGKTTTTHTATERNVLVEERKTFQGRAPQGFFANLADATMTVLGGGDHEELAQGNHDVLLEVDLPADLPETFEGKKSKVVYEAEIHLDIPAGRDFRQRVTFPLEGEEIEGEIDPEPLAIRYPEDQKKGFFDALFGPDVAMRVDVEATRVRRGDTIRGELEVRFPDRPGRVRAVVCQLQRRERSEAQSHKDQHVAKLSREDYAQRESTSNSLFVSFSVRVPDDAVRNTSGAKFTLTNELAVSLDVPWAKDPTIRIPITIV